MTAELIQKYVTHSGEDEAWGLYLLDVGKSKTVAGSNYPVGAHPPDYIFNFKRGRVLEEYQVLYISEGQGIFDSDPSGRLLVETGSVLLVYPGIRHRYRPSKRTGWRESWVGFRGPLADHIMQGNMFHPGQPVIKTGLHNRLNEIYDQILVECNQEKPGYQQLAAGLVMELLGMVHMYRKTYRLNNRYIESRINTSKRLMEELFRQDTAPREIARQLGMGYSNFRKQFRLYTGLSPGQYLIQLRIREAKSLLYNTHLPVKAIAEESGFNSSYYFVRLFRSKVGMTPGEFRQKARGLI